MRHAKSDWGVPGCADYDRGLNPRGLEAAPLMGRWLAKKKLVPDCIVGSSAKRAEETCRGFISGSSFEGKHISTRRLYLAEPETYLDQLLEVSPACRRVMFVGHNPGISELLFQLCGQSKEMPTAAVALLVVHTESWAGVDRTTEVNLQDLWLPRALKADGFI